MHRIKNVFTISVLITAFVAILMTACKSKPAKPSAKQNSPTVVDVLIAQSSSINNIVEANGTVIANEFVELRPELSGRLTYLNIPEGAFVNKGTLLARINDADLQAQLNKSKVQLELAQQTEERLKKLLDINGVNQADYDAALNQVNNLRADMAITQAAIDKSVIRAPFSGVIGLRMVSPGAYVTPSNVIATLQQLDKIKIDFTLPENYSNSLKKGNTVDIEIDAAQNIRRKATIIATEPQINQNTRNIKVRAVLQAGKGNPGAFVKVYVKASADKTSIMVPTTAIIPNDLTKQLILVKDGKAAFVNVTTGLREAENIEITKGIAVGDSVIVSGVLFARDKSPVQVRKVINNQN